MGKRLLLACVCCMIVLSGFAQKEANNWYFGSGAGITFNTSPPSALTNGKLYTLEGCATISTSKGRLLFYTDGISVWDSTHTKMPNGTGLKGNASTTQSAIIVPRPDSAHIFYIFTVDDQGGNDGLHYTEVNMKLNSGKGDVVTSNKNVQLKWPVCEKLTAIKKPNGIDYWVLAAKYGSDSFFSYSVTNSGVNKIPVASRTGMKIPFNSWALNTRGYLKVSPDGKKVAYLNSDLDTGCIADFDVSTGKISNLWKFYAPDCYGLEFSPQTNFLYISEFTNNKVVQYDLSSGTRSAFISSRKVIDSSYSDKPFALQLGPDGKIYISVIYATSLSVIHAPDSLKFSCRPQKNYISLSSQVAQLGLPNFIQSFFQKRTFSVSRNCLKDSTFFTISTLNGLDSVKWDFDDPGSGSANISRKTTAVSHIYNVTGYRTVSLITYFKTFRDTVKVKFYVKNPKPKLGRDTSFCNAFTYNIKPQKLYTTYAWSNSSTSPSLAVSQKGTYILKAKDSAGCFSSDTVIVSNPRVVAKFKLSDTMLCLTKNSFSMKDTSALTDDTRLKSTWHFGDGNNKVDTLAKKSYSSDGTYYIKLVIQSKLNCKDSVSKKIIVLPSASIAFTINKANQCFKGNSYNFTNSSTLSKGTMSYAWVFGDDSSSTLKDVTGKTYRKDSTFRVRLIVTTDKNCKDTLFKTTIVYPNPVTKFTVSKTAQCFNNNSTNFTNGSTIKSGFIFPWKWSLGDNTTSSFFNITKKKYATADSFNVMLLDISDKGCRDSLTKTIYIHPNTKIDFRINKAIQCFNGHSFDFSDSSKISKGTYTNDWDLGDGITSTSKDNLGKMYFKDSSYKIKLITTTDKNCMDTLSKTVFIYPNPKASFLILKPFQCFSKNISNYSNMSSISKGSITSYNWDLGDSTTSTSKNITGKHYNRADSFHIKMLVISDKGCRDSIKNSMVIHPSTDIGYIIDEDTQCYEWHRFNMTNTSSISKGFINTYDWAFGDGSTAQFVNIKNKKYNSFGNYYIRLITGTDKSCMDTLVKLVVLNASPIAGFNIDKNRQCFKNNVFNYTNTSTINNGSIITHSWDLGNAQFPATQHIANLKHLTEDTFKVRLIEWSDMGCTDTASQIAVTYAQPVVKFLVPNDSQCWQNNYFNIVNQTTLKYGTISHTWAFGDGTFDYTYKPLTKKYPNKSASYTIRYTAVSNRGCTDSAKHKITLLERPVSDFTINDSVQCFRGHLFSFVNNTTFSAMNTLTYYWNYGNGNNSTGKNALNATYPNAQYYNVRLVSYSSLTNCYDTIIRKVLPAPHAVPDFSVNLDSQCLRFNQFNFVNKSTLTFGQMTYGWTYNDNTFSTLKDPSKHYNTGASYPVKLVVTTNQLCKDSITKPIVLIPHPKANFIINDSTQCLNKHSFDFTNTSTLAYGTYASMWLFGDTTQGISKDYSSKQFKYPLWHKVTLTVNSNYNCTDTLTQTVYLENARSTSMQLTENDSQCMRWNRYTFSTTNSNPKVSVAGWNWNFGDGNSSVVSNPVYHYTKDGGFNVLVQTVSANGCLDTAKANVVLLPHPVSDFIASSPCNLEPVTFKDISTITTGKIVSYGWEFGDGNTSNVQDPTVHYKFPGGYNITLITESEYGCKDTLLRQNGVKVRTRPKALFTYSRLPSRLPEFINIHMNNQSSPDVTTNYWTFGNGNTSTDKDPDVEYEDTGKHLITLYVANTDGCKDTFRLNTALLYPDFYFYLPNSFSPQNTPGTNDYFMPNTSIYISYYYMEIYNRWGEKMFESSDIKKGWDGTYQGEPCEQGAYLCKIYIIPLNGKKQFHETSITLLR